MAIQIADNFSYQGKKALDGRITFSTLSAMVSMPDAILYNGCFAYVEENKKYYSYDSTNTVDETLGKWKEYESGSSITIDPTPTSGSVNAVQSGGTYTALDGKVDKVTGKGLSTNDFTNEAKTKLDGIDLTNYIPKTQKGANSGVAELDSSGKVPSSQLPSYVDDVVTRASKSAFPAEGEDDKIYIAKDENASYRWDGTEYVSISSANGLTLGETSSTAYRGDRGKTAYDDSQTNKTNIGTMSSLTTTEKSSLVGAINEVDADLADKVDKVTGKGLSTNDYDNTEKQKVTDAQPKTLATARTIEGASVTTVEGVAGAVQTHTEKVVTGNDGVHGFKVTTSGGETKMYYKSGNSWVEIEVGSSTQVSSLPTASQDNLGTVLQYVGNTTSVAPIYVHGYWYECVEDGGVYSWVNIPVMDVQEVQKTTLPTASADELGNIYQFVGTTTSSYTKGYYYECKAKGTEPETYEWENIDVQAGGGDADARIKSEIKEIGVRQNGTIFTPYIKFSYNLPPFSDLSWGEIGQFVQMYYDGDLSLQDIQSAWHLGDTHTISFSAMSAMENFDDAHSAQTAEVEIVDFNTYDIDGTEDKCLLTLVMKDCFNEKGIMDYARRNANIWENEPRRTWCNQTVYNAVESGVKSIIKDVGRTTNVVDKMFIPTARELMNFTAEYDYANFGTLYAHYATQANRIKKVNGTNDSYYSATQTGYASGPNVSYYSTVNTSGANTTVSMGTKCGLIVGFCI